MKNEYSALNIFQEIKDERWTADTYSTIGEEYFILGNYSEALQKSLSALKMYEQMGDKAPTWGIPTCYSDIGDVYEKQEEFEYASGNKAIAATKYTNALKNYLTSLKCAKKITIWKEWQRWKSQLETCM